MEDDLAGLACRQFAHQRLEGPHAVQHDGQPRSVSQPELDAQHLGLQGTVAAAGKVEADLADGLNSGRRHLRNLHPFRGQPGGPYQGGSRGGNLAPSRPGGPYQGGIRSGGLPFSRSGGPYQGGACCGALAFSQPGGPYPQGGSRCGVPTLGGSGRSCRVSVILSRPFGSSVIRSRPFGFSVSSSRPFGFSGTRIPTVGTSAADREAELPSDGPDWLANWAPSTSASRSAACRSGSQGCTPAVRSSMPYPAGRWVCMLTQGSIFRAKVGILSKFRK